MHDEKPENRKNQLWIVFDIQARGPQKREAPGIFPVCQRLIRSWVTGFS